MHLSTVEMVGIAVLAIAFITFRQTQWQPVDLTRLLRMPAVFAVLGVVSLVSAVKGGAGTVHVGALDVLIIGGELAGGLLAGYLMGRTTQVRRFGDTLKARLGAAGVGVWLSFIAVRIGLAALAHLWHTGLAEQSGTVLLVVAMIKVVQALMVRERIARHVADEEPRVAAPAGRNETAGTAARP